jgi:hypothetical protein
VNRLNQRTAILQSLEAMLYELTAKELDSLEDFIVNQCDDSYVDDNGNSPNIFRMLLDEE